MLRTLHSAQQTLAHTDEKAPPKHTLFGPREEKEPFPIDLVRSVVRRLNDIFINKEDLMSFKTLFAHHPILLRNSPLNEANQTSLILAAINNRDDIVKFLLMNGADKTYMDNKGCVAMDYASTNRNTPLCTLLQSNITVADHANLLINLRDKISDFLKKIQDENSSKQIVKILTIALTQINRHELEKYQSDNILDLYFTINSVFKILYNLTPEDDLQKKVKEFLSLRENILRGDAHDYCFTQSLANEFCYQLAEITFPNADSIPNILLANALVEGRDTPWFDHILMSQQLPDSPCDYFRTSSNHIHLYGPIVDKAIPQLKRGLDKHEYIFLGTDIKNMKEVEEKKATFEPKSLSIEELNILVQRTPTLETLVNYVLSFVKLNKGEIFRRFSDLRAGLLKGDVAHSGEEKQAGSAAYEAVAEFAEWWNSLAKSTSGSEIQNKILAIRRAPIEGRGMRESEELPSVLKIILDDGNAKVRDKTVYCIQIKGRHLEEVLSDKSVRDAFDSIDTNWRATDEQLNTWHKKIEAELKNPCSIIGNKNIFQSLSDSPDFIKRCQKLDSLDYYSISKQYTVIALFDKFKKLESPGLNVSDMLDIIRDIFSINDLNYLLMLHAEVCNITSKNKKNLILFATAIRLKILNYNKNHILHDSKHPLLTADFNSIFQMDEGKKALNILLYFAVKLNQTDAVECLLKQGAKWVFVNTPTLSAHSDNNDDLYFLLPSLFKNNLSVWDHLFKYKDAEIAALLVNQANLLAQDDVLLTAKTNEEWAFILDYLKQISLDKLTPAFLKSLCKCAVDAKQDQVTELLFSAKGSAPLLEFAFEKRYKVGIEKILQADAKVTHNEALLSSAKQGHWDCVATYLTYRNPMDKTILHALLCFAVAAGQIDVIKCLIKYGANLSTQSPSLPPPKVGSQYDVLDTQQKWLKATILEMKDDKVHVKYNDWSDKWNEWIDFKNDSQRFANYGTRSNGNQDTSVSVWSHLFKYQNAEIAALLVNQADLPAQDDVLLTAKRGEEWTFILNYLKQIPLDKLTPAFLKSLCKCAFDAKQDQVTEYLFSAKCSAPLLEFAFEKCHKVGIEKILQADAKVTHNKALLSSAKQGHWDCVATYLTYRNPKDKPTLNALLCFAIAAGPGQIDVIKCLIKYGANLSTQSPSLPPPKVGSQYDVLDTSSRWFKATILEMKDDKVHVKYDGYEDKWNEWIDFKNDSRRFANYGTQSNGDQDISVSVWGHLFKYQNAEIAALLVNQADLPAQDYILLTAKTNEEWKFILNYLKQIALDKLTPAFLKSLCKCAIDAKQDQVTEYLFSAKGSAPLLELAFEKRYKVGIEKILQADEKITHNEALLSSAKQGHWDCVATYLTYRNPKDKPTLNALLCFAIAVGPGQIDVIKCLIKYGANLSMQSPSLPPPKVGSQYDVLDKRTWRKAAILEVKDDKVHVKYDGYEDKWNEWIDFKNDSRRFANYGTQSNGDQDISVSVWEHLFKYQNAEIAILLVNQADLPAQDYILLTAKTNEEWTFILNYLKQIPLNKFTLNFLKELKKLASAEKQQKNQSEIFNRLSIFDALMSAEASFSEKNSKKSKVELIEACQIDKFFTMDYLMPIVRDLKNSKSKSPYMKFVINTLVQVLSDEIEYESDTKGFTYFQNTILNELIEDASLSIDQKMKFLAEFIKGSTYELSFKMMSHSQTAQAITSSAVVASSAAQLSPVELMSRVATDSPRNTRRVESSKYENENGLGLTNRL